MSSDGPRALHGGQARVERGTAAASTGMPRRFPKPFLLRLCRHSPVKSIWTLRDPHSQQTSRACQSGAVISAPYRSAISAGSGSA